MSTRSNPYPPAGCGFSLTRELNRASRVVAFLVATAAIALGQPTYSTNPNWISSDTQVSTGGALVDLDRDGWLDFVVANGNDMVKQRLVVYYNNGAGALSGLPGWQSSDLAYNGHLSVADVNGDGWPDVAVSILVNEGGSCAKLYLNNGGTLESTPSWTSSLVAPSFTCAFGDVNNDGRPDLAIATGFPYDANPHAYKNVVHLNVGGALEQTPSWQSSDTWCYNSALWVDANVDGWLDLVLLGGKTATRLYLNQGGVLSTSANWSTTDVSSQFALMAVASDLGGDGRPELIFADNNQLTGGSGRFRRYEGVAGGTFATTASWTFLDGYCSAVALADVDADGDLDLATGAWWDLTRIFTNNAGAFGASSTWQSASTSVVEKIVFGDVDRNARKSAADQFGPGQRLLQLSRRPIEAIVKVTRDGVELSPAEYTYDREAGWVTIGVPATSLVTVEFVYSTRLDMAVTNWDNTIGNYLYFNQLAIPGDINGDKYVNQKDLGSLLASYGLCSGQPGFNPAADLDGSGCVDQADLGILLANYSL